MNKSLCALMTKLQWQLGALKQQLLDREQQLFRTDQLLVENQNTLLNASKPQAFILPEREIAGLHFIMAQQQQQDELRAKKSELLSQIATLTARKLRLDTELKMLEKHQENQEKIKRQQDQITLQNNADEWIVQRRSNT